jgi:hypothetical protein
MIIINSYLTFCFSLFTIRCSLFDSRRSLIARISYSLRSQVISAEFGGVRGVAQSFCWCFFALFLCSSLFYSTPSGLWFLVDAFLVVNFDPFRVTLSLLRIVLILTQKRFIQSRIFYFRMPRFRILTLDIDDKIVVVSIVSELLCNQCIR